VLDFKNWYKFDFITFSLLICLTGFGLFVISGATGETQDGGLFYSQFKRILLGFVCLFAILFVEYRNLVKYSPLLYLVGILGLLFCFVPGLQHISHGASSWINLFGFLQIQPGEFAKIATIFMLANILSSKKHSWDGLWGMIIPLLIGVFPAILILAQPDMGTAIVFGPITLIMMFVAGMPVTHLIILFSPVLCLLGITHDILFILLWISLITGLLLMAFLKQIPWTVWMPFLLIGVIAYGAIFHYGEDLWEKFPKHQRNRIVGYLNPDFDPLVTNFNINQSKIALGSGGFWGKGIGQGTQSKYRFLPEYEHDFVFSILGEQIGFLGSAIVLGLFLLLIIRGLDTAIVTKTLQGALIASGIVSLYFTHIVINVGMVTGLLPVTGLPLTFISYGGTFMLSNMIGIGLLMNIRMRTSSELLKDSFSAGRPTMRIPSEIPDDF
jgi:rod shape determining protein RodA